LLPIQVLRVLFRGKFLDALRQAYDAGQLKLAGSTAALSQPRAWRQFLDLLYKIPPCAGRPNPTRGVLHSFEALAPRSQF